MQRCGREQRLAGMQSRAPPARDVPQSDPPHRQGSAAAAAGAQRHLRAACPAADGCGIAEDMATAGDSEGNGPAEQHALLKPGYKRWLVFVLLLVSIFNFADRAILA